MRRCGLKMPKKRASDCIGQNATRQEPRTQGSHCLTPKNPGKIRTRGHGHRSPNHNSEPSTLSQKITKNGCPKVIALSVQVFALAGQAGIKFFEGKGPIRALAFECLEFRI